MAYETRKRKALATDEAEGCKGAMLPGDAPIETPQPDQVSSNSWLMTNTTGNIAISGTQHHEQSRPAMLNADLSTTDIEITVLWHEVKTIRQETQSRFESMQANHSDHMQLLQKDHADQMQLLQKLVETGLAQTSFAGDAAANMNPSHLAGHLSRDEKRELNKITKERDQAVQTVKGLQQELARLSDELGSTQQQLAVEWAANHVSKALNVHKISDDDILGKWKELNYSIRLLAAFLSQADFGSIDSSMQRILSSVTYQSLAKLRNNDLRPYVFQAYIWFLVVQKVFDGKSDAWGGDARGALQQLKSKLAHSTSYIEDGGEKLGKLVSDANHVLEQITPDADEKEVANELAVAAGLPIGSSLINSATKPATLGRVHRELFTIFQTALELHRLMLSSRAFFCVAKVSIRTDRTGIMRFNGKYMTAVECSASSPEGQIVEVNISPAVIKYGNSDGQDYDQSMLLVKANVACK